MDESGDRSAEPADADLLRLARDGDRRAYSELWRRHAPVAVAYARSLGHSPMDAEDAVSEAFISILHLLRAGRGPEERFRPYLLTTVRNIRLNAATRGPATTPLDEIEEPCSELGRIDVDAMVNSAAITEAFRSLPERWQHALWLSEVEQLPPRTIAQVLDLRPNSVAALTYRARDALRKAWIGAQLRRAQAGTDHAKVIEMLGAYAHDDLAPRSERFVTSHLHSCPDCSAAAGEARHLARAMTLGPLLAGGGALVVAPALFPAEQAAAAALVSLPHSSGWMAFQAPLQALFEQVAGAGPIVRPVAAAAVLALTIGGGSVLTPPPQEPDAAALVAPEPVAAVEETVSSTWVDDSFEPTETAQIVTAASRLDPAKPATAHKDDGRRGPHDDKRDDRSERGNRGDRSTADRQAQGANRSPEGTSQRWRTSTSSEQRSDDRRGGGSRSTHESRQDASSGNDRQNAREGRGHDDAVTAPVSSNSAKNDSRDDRQADARQKADADAQTAAERSSARDQSSAPEAPVQPAAPEASAVPEQQTEPQQSTADESSGAHEDSAQDSRGEERSARGEESSGRSDGGGPSTQADRSGGAEKHVAEDHAAGK